MIQKWENEKNWDELAEWWDNVEDALRDYHTDKLYIGHLSINDLEDDLDVAVEDSKLEITLSEGTYETTDMRDNNIQVIKFFVEEELPYYEFEEQTESPYSKHGFRLIFKLKEGSK